MCFGNRMPLTALQPHHTYCLIPGDMKLLDGSVSWEKHRGESSVCYISVGKVFIFTAQVRLLIIWWTQMTAGCQVSHTTYYFVHYFTLRNIPLNLRIPHFASQSSFLLGTLTVKVFPTSLQMSHNYGPLSLTRTLCGLNC